MSDENGLVSLLPLVALVVFAYLLFIRPARKRAKEVQQLQQALSPGDEIMLTSGIFGTVVEVDGEVLKVEVSPGAVLTVHRGAAGKIVRDAPTVMPTSNTDDGSHGVGEIPAARPAEPTTDDPDARGAH